MPTIIMDSCSYTRLGLMDYMTVKGVKKKISTSFIINASKLSLVLYL